MEVHLAFGYELTKENVEYLSFLLFSQVVVADGEMDARLNGDIKGCNAIRRQYDNAFEVLEDSEKYYALSVGEPLHIIRR